MLSQLSADDGRPWYSCYLGWISADEVSMTERAAVDDCPALAAALLLTDSSMGLTAELLARAL